MPINADTLLDRLQLKHQLKRWRLIAVLLAVLVLIVVFDRGNVRGGGFENFIARVTLEGIVEDDRKFYDLLEDLTYNPRVKAVVLWLNTPGGSAVGGEETYARLRTLSERKPVVSVMRSVSASAGYMVALGTDYIVAREGTITGSIGALIETVEVTDLAGKLGIEPVIVKSGSLKASPNPLEKTTPEAREMAQQVVDDFYRRFLGMVSERRKLSRGQMALIADGRIFSGRQALEIRLVDALGGEEVALEWLEKEKQVSPALRIRDVEPERDLPLLAELTQSMAGYFFPKNRVALDGVRAIWHPQLQ